MMVDQLDALRARDDLLAVAAAWPALRARLRPSGGTSEIHTPPESRPPIAIPAHDLMQQIEDKVDHYAHVLIVDEDYRFTTSEMPGKLEEVASRYGHFTHRSGDRMALDFLDDAHEMRRMVDGFLASNEPPRWLGPCPEGECGGDLYQAAWSLDAECRECGRTVDAAEWRALMEAAFESRLMTVSELVSALVVTGHYTPEETKAAENTIRTWIHRGRLPKTVEDPDLYSFATAHELAELRARRRTA